MNISAGYTRFRGKVMPVLYREAIKRKERESRTPGRQIKKEICEKFGLRSNQVKVNWGPDHLLKIRLANDIYEDIGREVRSFVEAGNWGFIFYDFEIRAAQHPTVSVTNFDGLQRIFSAATDIGGLVKVDWVSEGF